MKRHLLTQEQCYKRNMENIIEMLEDQNFLNPDGREDNLDIACETISPDQIEFTHHLDSDKQCTILFLSSDNIIKRDSIRKLVDLENKKMRYMLVIKEQEIVKHLKGFCKTHAILKEHIVQTMANPLISIFKYRDFDFKKMKHKYQPKCRVMPKEEAERVISRYGEISNFPKMFDSDYVAKHYNVKIELNKRAIFEITAPSETSGSCISYRHVIPHYFEN